MTREKDGTRVLNPTHLRALVAVVRTGSFADAARQLGYTASAVSQQIAALERSVQVPLFGRGPHSVRPTPAAEFLAARSQVALTTLESLVEDVRGMCDGTVGTLRLGSFPTASQRLLPIALATFARTHPRVEVQLDEAEPAQLVQLMQDAALDLALIYQYDLVPSALPSQLEAMPLLHEHLLLLLPCTHRHADAGSIALADLQGETWVATREDTSGRMCLERACASAGFTPRVAYQSNDYNVIRGLVQAGLGIALVPALGHEPGPTLAEAHVEGLTAGRRVLALHAPERSNAVVLDAVRALRESVQQLPGDALPSWSEVPVQRS